MTNAERLRLVHRYAQGPALLRTALSRVPERARKWRPGPGKWSVHEVICHCADAEITGAARIRYLISEKKPLLVGYNQDEWAVRLDYHRHPLKNALAAVIAIRANTAPLIRRQPARMWRKSGRHTESGRYTAEKWLRAYAAHLEGHAGQIRRILSAWKRRSSP